MLTRRAFLGTVGAGLALSHPLAAWAAEGTGKKRLAVVTTEWRYHSHAWHMAERFSSEEQDAPQQQQQQQP